MLVHHLQAVLLKESLSVIMIEQEQFCVLPGTELCEAKKLDETDTE